MKLPVRFDEFFGISTVFEKYLRVLLVKRVVTELQLVTAIN